MSSKLQVRTDGGEEHGFVARYGRYGFVPTKTSNEAHLDVPLEVRING